ncbi:cytochrome P450 [Cyathus striatus]|nr:cytochrome P450 [Cyathus striatus]
MPIKLPGRAGYIKETKLPSSKPILGNNMAPTPGVIFIFQQLPIPALIFLTSYLLARSQPVAAWIPWFLPASLLALFTTFLSFPLRVLIYVQLKEYRHRREAERIGARLAPRLVGKEMGNRDQMRWLMKCWREGYPGDGLWEIMKQYGYVVDTHVFWIDNTFTLEPEHLKIILSTDAENYVKGERFRFAFHDVLGDGIFNADSTSLLLTLRVYELTRPIGDIWKFHRSISRPFFTHARISNFTLFEQSATDVIRLINERMETGTAIDFQDLMQRYTLETGTAFLFGSTIHTLSSPAVTPSHLPLPYPLPPSPLSQSAEQAFATAFHAAQEVIATRERRGWMWPLKEIFEDTAKVHMDVVTGYLDTVLERAMERKRVKDEEREKLGGKVEEEETLLDHLLTVTSDPVLVKDEVLNVLIAARDTMAATLTFCIYFLTQHPEVAQKLRQEVLEKVGAEKCPTYEEIKEMRYLKAVLNETLRLLPPVPFNVREARTSTTWPSPDPTQKPIYIPAGSSVPYSVIMMHRRKDLWGPDAEEFDPERFLDERLKKYLVPNPFIFLPFNGGPRICIGQQLAYNQMSYLLIRILQSFSSFILCPDAFPPDARPPKEWEGMEGRKGKEKFRPLFVLTMSSKVVEVANSGFREGCGLKLRRRMLRSDN